MDSNEHEVRESHPSRRGGKKWTRKEKKKVGYSMRCGSFPQGPLFLERAWDFPRAQPSSALRALLAACLQETRDSSLAARLASYIPTLFPLEGVRLPIFFEVKFGY